MKDKVFLGVIVVLLIVIVFQRLSSQKRELSLIADIEETDSLKQLAQGNYQKLVVQHDQTKRQLKKLVQENSTMDSIIDAKDEKILMYEKITITLENMIDTMKVKVDTIKEDSLVYVDKSFSVCYPSESDCFMNFTGVVRQDRLAYEWDISTLEISLALTETKSGTWMRRVDGPDWLLISDLQVNSLPKQDLSSESDIKVMGGVGYFRTNQNHFALSGGVEWNTFQLTGSVGNDLVGLNFMYIFGK